MAIRKEQAANDTPDISHTKQEWIERAQQLRAERFEIAGALFDVQDGEKVTENEVKKRLTKYKGGV